MLSDSSFAFVAYYANEADQGFEIIDVADSSQFHKLGTGQTAAKPVAIDVRDSIAVVASNSEDSWFWEAYDVKDATKPKKLGGPSGEGFIADILIDENGLVIASIPSGSLHYYSIDLNNPVFTWISLFICHSPYSTVIAPMQLPFYSLFFSIDGYFCKDTKQISGSWGLFFQKMIIAKLLANLQVNPKEVFTNLNDTTDFDVKGFDAQGNEVQTDVEWSATGGEIDPETGKYVATQVGDFKVIATDKKSNKSDTAKVHVTAPVVEIIITPQNPHINVGDTLKFGANGYDAQGNEVTIDVQWSATGGYIDPKTGKYTATEAGTFTVTALDTNSGEFGTTQVYVTSTGVRVNAIVPNEFSLSQNYPNPFNPTTTIEFGVREPCWVRLKIFDIRSREVAVLANEYFRPGIYRVNFDGSKLPSGIYFYRIQMKDFTAVKKMLLLE